MALSNTTIIPLDNDVEAQQQFSDLINSDKILMVILGNSDAIKKGVTHANELTGSPSQGHSRWVIWIANHVVLKDSLEAILNEAGIIEDNTPYEEIKAFCLTQIPRKANSRIHKNGSLGIIRLLKLFREAESQS